MGGKCVFELFTLFCLTKKGAVLYGVMWKVSRRVDTNVCAFFTIVKFCSVSKFYLKFIESIYEFIHTSEEATVVREFLE